MQYKIIPTPANKVSTGHKISNLVTKSRSKKPPGHNSRFAFLVLLTGYIMD